MPLISNYVIEYTLCFRRKVLPYALLELRETALMIDVFMSLASPSIFPLHFDIF